MRSLILILALSFISAQISDRDVRPDGWVDRQTIYNHNRDTADTLTHAPDGWNSQFIQDPGDAMLVVYQIPGDLIIKGVNHQQTSQFKLFILALHYYFIILDCNLH